MTASQIENIGNQAIRNLRRSKFVNGQPFMINSKDLPSNMCYLEYPDGKMTLVSIQRELKDFNFIRNLSPVESNEIRQKYNLSM